MKQQNAKEVVLTIVVGLLIVYYFTQNQWVLYAAMLIGVLGVFSDFFAEKLTWAWMKLAHVMGSITSPILLGLVFFVFLTPMATLKRLFSKVDNLRLKNIGNSAYEERNHTYQAKDLENIW